MVETDYDRDTGESIKNPKLRVRGKLREVYKVKGKEREKSFQFHSRIYSTVSLKFNKKCKISGRIGGELSLRHRISKSQL